MLQVIPDDSWRLFTRKTDGRIYSVYKRLSDAAPVGASRRENCDLAFDYRAADGSVVGVKYLLPSSELPEWMRDEKNWAIQHEASKNWADGPTMFVANPDPDAPSNELPMPRWTTTQ